MPDSHKPFWLRLCQTIKPSVEYPRRKSTALTSPFYCLQPHTFVSCHNMPRSPKSPGSPEGSLDNPEVRKRVVRACQRCRLKKCKCDGATPCTRCKSDDAICAYGKHKKSDKTVFRSGYVQMLERSHAQLTAGLQELYRRTQNGEGWIGPRLEVASNNQPLTHKILEALGVLQTGDWEEMESADGTWQGFEGQRKNSHGWMYSESTSPSTQATFSPNSPTQTAFPQSTIMSKRRSKLQTELPPITQTLTRPPPPVAVHASVKPEPYNHAFPHQMSTPPDTLTSDESMSMYFDRAGGSTMDWSFGMDDLFSNLGGQEQAIQGC